MTVHPAIAPADLSLRQRHIIRALAVGPARRGTRPLWKCAHLDEAFDARDLDPLEAAGLVRRQGMCVCLSPQGKACAARLNRATRPAPQPQGILSEFRAALETLETEEIALAARQAALTAKLARCATEATAIETRLAELARTRATLIARGEDLLRIVAERIDTPHPDQSQAA